MKPFQFLNSNAAAVVFSLLFSLVICSMDVNAQNISLSTKCISVKIDKSGYINSIKEKGNGKEYCPKGYTSALLTLSRGKDVFLPVAAKYNRGENQITLTYPNGSVAMVSAESKGEYLRFKLMSLTPRNEVDNIIWGPYKTNISKTIGDMISVVRDDRFAIGILGLDDNTIIGPPTDGDLGQLHYYIHSPDPVKYPLPANLKEGQKFSIGGDGISDVAFFSHPEEYFRMTSYNGAALEPEFGSSLVVHARDRRKPQLIFYTMLPGFTENNQPRHQYVDPVDVDYIGSGIGFYGCPDSLGLKTIEKIILGEGLPHIKDNGKWIHDPLLIRPDMAWYGAHDSLVSYARQLGLKAVQDEGLGEYYINPSNRWAGKQVSLVGKKVPIAEFTKLTNQEGIAYGLHTLCQFTQPHSSDVSPVPSDSLCTVLRTALEKGISATDTLIYVADTSYLNEKGTWHDNKTNVLKIGKELLTYKGVTRVKPYLLTGIRRGAYKTSALPHQQGDVVSKLQVNCYHGFISDMNLQDKYAEFYAKLLVDGGMDYIDFDGLESCSYQGHGTYSYNRFFRKLFDEYYRLGGKYLRVMAAGTQWLYMNLCNVGGDQNMYDPIRDQWGIEGKDIRYMNESNYFPCTFGIQNMKADWTPKIIETLQARSVGWDATYMLGLSQKVAEKCPSKYEIFRAFRTWENARAANAFTPAVKEKLRRSGNNFHIEQTGPHTWKLYLILSNGEYGTPEVLKRHLTGR